MATRPKTPRKFVENTAANEIATKQNIKSYHKYMNYARKNAFCDQSLKQDNFAIC